MVLASLFPHGGARIVMALPRAFWGAQMADLMGVVERLKRHHMFRVASWYATAAYVLILVANAVFPDIGLTRGEVRYLIAGLALGFPIALVIGWTFVPPSQDEPEKLSEWQRARWR